MNNQQNPRFSVQPQQGQRLPDNWRENAAARARMADAAYKHNLENAWKKGYEGTDPNVMRSARLVNNGNGPTPEDIAMRSRLNGHKPPDWEDLLGRQ